MTEKKKFEKISLGTHEKVAGLAIVPWRSPALPAGPARTEVCWPFTSSIHAFAQCSDQRHLVGNGPWVKKLHHREGVSPPLRAS